MVIKRHSDVLQILTNCLTNCLNAQHQNRLVLISGGALLRQLIGSEWRQLSAGVCALDCAVPIS